MSSFPQRMRRMISMPPICKPALRNTLFLLLASAGQVLPLHGQSRGPALPRVYLDTNLPEQHGRVLAAAADCKNLQAQIDAARPGDTIEIPAGAVCTGRFVLPPKPSGGGWVVIRTANAETALPHGVRVSPAGSGRMAKILTPNSGPAIVTAPGAHHYRLVGLEIGVQAEPQPSINYGIIGLGDATKAQSSLDQVPGDIIIDRCYIHGNPTLNVSRGIALNSARTAVIDSYISEIHGEGFDTQAICGWNGPGPFKIVNNYLEAAGENIMFGGAVGYISDIIPSDIEIRTNHLFKPLRWNRKNPATDGSHWTVKNHLEFKNAQRVLADGNVFENNWVDAQVGYSILFTVRTQQKAMLWNAVQDITLTHNIVRNSQAGVTILGIDDTSGAGKARLILIRHNLFEALGPGPGFLLVSAAEDVTIDHNTVLMEKGQWSLLFDGKPEARFAFTNNIVSETRYGVTGSGTRAGTPVLERYAPGAVFRNNLITGGSSADYPSSNSFPKNLQAIGFVRYDDREGDYQIGLSSRYKSAASDHTSPGADMRAVRAATRNAISERP